LNLGMSTVWRSATIRDGGRLLGCLRAFDPLDGLELEYRILPDTLETIARAVRAGQARILSLHNYCPHPAPLPPEQAGGDAFLLSSPDPREQALAVSHTRNTLRWAAELNARAVVLHLGRVEMEEPMERLQALHATGARDSRTWETLIGTFRRERARRRPAYLGAVQRSLSRILPLADRLGIRVGLENRYYLREIPDLEEVGLLLEAFKGGPVGYWHDMGHAGVQANLGLQDPASWTREYAGSLLGAHIHDTRGMEDHLAPGEGGTDFAALAPCFRPGVLKILEIRPTETPEAVRRGISLVRDLCARAATPSPGQHRAPEPRRP